MIFDKVTLLCIGIDIIGIIICLLLWFDFGSYSRELKTYDKRLFNLQLSLIIILFISDITSWIFIELKTYHFATATAIAVYYSLHLFIGTIWIMYCDYTSDEDKEHTKKIGKIFLIPSVIIAILSFISYKYPIMFTINDSGEYLRGNYYIVFVVINMFYLFYSIYLILKQIIKNRKKKVHNTKLFVLIIYPILPLVGSIIQTLVYGLNFTWILSTVSLIIVYFKFQNAQLVIDPLTKISNRYRFDAFLDKQFYEQNPDKIMFLALVDLDKFKMINDNFGHVEGDLVLVEVAKILREQSDFDDFVARLGGDEFVIFGTRKNEHEIVDLIKALHFELAKYNTEANKPYDVSFSIGYALQDNQNVKTKREILIEADTNMYKNKKAKRLELL